jgi:hypothetical protein
MLKKLLSLLLVVALLFGVGTVLAQQDEDVDHGFKVIRPDNEDTPTFATFKDGRINAYDIGAPLVIFYEYETVPVIGPDGNQAWEGGRLAWEDKLAAIEVLSVDQLGLVNLALRATVEDIQAAVETAGETDCCLIENGPVSLHYSESGWFWVEGQYHDGKPYTFQWEVLDF